ncbi:hypothetical protein NC652_011105 [Populus alba x Populus x berolinensis]|nr:hypothetical protein NC652_011105 [Populus alba x Populus x berolinensis]
MSAPLVYSNHSQQIHKKTTTIATHDDIVNHFPIKENTMEGLLSTRDVGTQSTPPDLSSSSSSPSPGFKRLRLQRERDAKYMVEIRLILELIKSQSIRSLQDNHIWLSL